MPRGQIVGKPLGGANAIVRWPAGPVAGRDGQKGAFVPFELAYE